MAAEQQTLMREYAHAHKMPFLHFKCSRCGRLVGRDAIGCSCGADLR